MRISAALTRFAPLLLIVFFPLPVNAATLNQTMQFTGVAPETLYDAFLSSQVHGAMTLDGTKPATFYRASTGNVRHGQEGDELLAVGMKGLDGKIRYAVTAKILKLVPGKLIVMSWKNWVWDQAINPVDVTNLASIVVLTFKKNLAGAEIQLVQVNVPDYAVKIADTGETGPLSSLVNTHWSLVYWEPMKKYFQERARNKENGR